MHVQTDSYPAAFAARWGHLRDARVRALAWLLDAPDLLDAHDPYWQGRIATVGPLTQAVCDWLATLDADPAPLAAALGDRPYTRLGLFAEKLMAFYYREQGLLVAHGLQVRAARNDTVGEFDFLLDAGPDGLEHIEFATKFYLLQGSAAGRFDTFVGPNLADSLGKKMRKIFEHQLALGTHPAAQALLPRPVLRALALVKGWLFYPAGEDGPQAGMSPQHCRGRWCTLGQMDGQAGARYVVLPKLAWLAPYQGPADETVLDLSALALRLDGLAQPALVASVRQQGDVVVEVTRTFVVPDDWAARAAAWAR